MIAGSLLSAYINRLENALIVAAIYEFIALPLSGVYLSIKYVDNINLTIQNK